MAGTAPLRPTWALGEDIQQFLQMQGGWWPRGLLSCVPVHSRSAGSALAGPRSIAPLSLGGGSSPPGILPPWPSDCLVLQLSLPCVPGDLLAASSGKPRPQTPPVLRIETPLPRSECSPAAPAACTLHTLVSSTAPWPSPARPLSPSQGSLGPACRAVSSPALTARLERGTAPAPPCPLQLAPVQA